MIAFGDSRGGGIPHGGHSMSLDPPHFVPRLDKLSVNSPYWQQAPFNSASGLGPAGWNPYGPDEADPHHLSLRLPHATPTGPTSCFWMATSKATLDALGYVLVDGEPQLQTAFTPPLPLLGSNALWNGHGVDEFAGLRDQRAMTRRSRQA